MKTNRVTYFVVLAISVMLLTAGFILYYPSVVGFGYPSLFFYTLGFATLIFSLFGLIFNKTMTKHFNIKTFGISILPFSVLFFTAFYVYLFYDNVIWHYIHIKDMSNPKVELNFDFILEYLFNDLILTSILVIFSIVLFVATIFINIKIRKKQNLLKRGLFLDYGLALPFSIFGGCLIFILLDKLF